MNIYKDINPILIGSRAYGVFDEDSDYDFLLLVPSNQVSTIISFWLEGEIFNITPLENPKRYNIIGKTRGLQHLKLPGYNIPDDAVYDITIIPKGNMSDSKFLSSNWTIRQMISISKIEEQYREELHKRLSAIRKWAKQNMVYGGCYPSGISYFIYTYNTIKGGYTFEESLQLLHQKHLYYHPERKYSHMKYVGTHALSHISNLIHGQVPKLPIKYQIEITKGLLSDALKAIQYLLQDYKFRIYTTNNGYIYSEKEIDASWWIQELKSYDIHVNVIKT